MLESFEQRHLAMLEVWAISYCQGFQTTPGFFRGMTGDPQKHTKQTTKPQSKMFGSHMAHVKVVFPTKKHGVFEDVGSKGLNRLHSPENNITACPWKSWWQKGTSLSFWVWRPNCQGRTVGFRGGISYDFKMLMLKPDNLEFISSNATRLNINLNP